MQEVIWIVMYAFIMALGINTIISGAIMNGIFGTIIGIIGIVGNAVKLFVDNKEEK